MAKVLNTIVWGFTLLCCAAPARAALPSLPTDAKAVASCMVGVLQMLPQTVRVEFTTEYNRESGSFALINYEYRDAQGKIQRVRFPVHADDGLYHYPETGAFGK